MTFFRLFFSWRCQLVRVTASPASRVAALVTYPICAQFHRGDYRQIWRCGYFGGYRLWQQERILRKPDGQLFSSDPEKNNNTDKQRNIKLKM